MRLATGTDGRSAVPIGSVLMEQPDAAFDRLADAVDPCPDELPDDPTNSPECWYLGNRIAGRPVGRR